MLDYEILKDILDTKYIGRTFLQFECLQSSNKKARSILSHSPNGMVIFAQEQWDGKINKNNSWYSPKGGLYLSIIIKNKINLDMSNLLNLMTLSAIYNSLYQYGIVTSLKWPNDLLYKNKRLGAISVDKYTSSDEASYIIDICFNFNIEEKDLIENVDSETISLLNITKLDVSYEKFIADILNNVEKDYYKYLNTKDTNHIIKPWHENCRQLNEKIQIRKIGNKKWIDVEIDGLDSLGKLIFVNNNSTLDIIDVNKYEMQIFEGKNENR